VSRQLFVRAERWASKVPFRISGRSWDAFDLVVCELHEDGCVGRGEAAGVFYLDEQADGIRAQIDSVAEAVRGPAASTCASCCRRVARATRSIARCGTSSPAGAGARRGRRPASRRRR
jgi:L-alanine-DL-glutamate epimerase-like enolase superfamily enzyme